MVQQSQRIFDKVLLFFHALLEPGSYIDQLCDLNSVLDPSNLSAVYEESEYLRVHQERF